MKSHLELATELVIAIINAKLVRVPKKDPEKFVAQMVIRINDVISRRRLKGNKK